MRGIVVVLVLATLVCSALAQDCSGNGAKTSTDACICASGFAGANCAEDSNSLSQACPLMSKPLDARTATWFPNLAEPTTASDPLNPVRFVSNTLYAKLVGNYVAARTYTELTFVASAAQKALNAAADVAKECKLGNTGSYWAQAVDKTACNDTFSLVLPWNKHTDCGFANNTAKTTSEDLFITGYLYIKYSDKLGEIDGFNLTRSTKVPYSVSVKFMRHVKVELVALNVTSNVRYGMALTEDVYDPDAMTLTLEITSIINWPNMYFTGDKLIFYKPDQVIPQQRDSNGFCSDSHVCGTPLDVFPQNVDCGNIQEGSLCTQKFTIVAKLDQLHPKNCTYDGQYDITAPLYTCRDVVSTGQHPDCTHADLNITFFIDQSWVCGEIDVAPKVDGQLYAFDPMYTTGFKDLVAQKKYITNFQLGKYGHFYAAIDSQDNLLSVQFRDISFTVQNQGNWRSLYNSSGWDVEVGAGAASSYAESFPARPAIVETYVNTDHKYFKVYFHSSIFKVNPNSQVIYTFRATLDLSFKGNDHYDADGGAELKKRTIETTWEQSVFNAQTNVFMRAPSAINTPANVEAVAPVDNGVSSVTFIASVVGAVAGTMIIVFVVVGFALRARSQSKDEPNSSLIAASAAAAEVANRA